MCGITGIFNISGAQPVQPETLKSMADAINHRGPDDSSYIVHGDLGLGFKRLSIIDLAHGQQPFYSEDQSVVMICNGEIYNYKELRKELVAKGYTFKTNCDVEVIVHLYADQGIRFIDKLNGQFAFCLYDSKARALFLARDHFGICPLFYTVVNNSVVFASEIKAILKHPAVRREVNLTALDQIFSFPGIVSPTTFFKGVENLKAGHFLKVQDGVISKHEYWDLDYPQEANHAEVKNDEYYIEQLEELLLQSVKYRLNADVPVGFYLSGGLDSSLVGALMKKVNPDFQYKSFSIGYPSREDADLDERKYQRMMATHLNSLHTEIEFDWANVADRLKDAIYYSEGALKESYNTCSLALSETVRKHDVKVILSGEGSDEFFGGYVGYRFDAQGRIKPDEKSIDDMLEDELREKLWGDPNFFYESNYHEFRNTTQALYSQGVNKAFPSFGCLDRLEINRERLNGRHSFHKRSYLDLKLRLSDHLISDHADRVNYANSVEGRYPFLDIAVIDFVRTIPPQVKIKGLVEKYILKQLAKKFLPLEISNRQKFAWVAPGSNQLLKNKTEWVHDMLSPERIKRQGYFNSETIERLKQKYQKDNFKLNLPYDSDILMVVLTFNIFLEVFDMPDYNG
ncbi:asparagine synthase (glutamine-hydrolyzing) [Chryseolinea lacunae]|uniref:asparagine synthase (glutamine-hydrolyzing) n=1 Tax=Chryseolinea lacunae TaxID=2801331 RepID=A0ABS1KV63_9BACT|nr:asparagine synthase (glutamine-hydrolyzing) [Chryseolinea lacunae]MBL0743083.1 asparagine synthase (glutamine-hydrolyzing) [Chryseolinea lacunae]